MFQVTWAKLFETSDGGGLGSGGGGGGWLRDESWSGEARVWKGPVCGGLLGVYEPVPPISRRDHSTLMKKLIETDFYFINNFSKNL